MSLLSLKQHWQEPTTVGFHVFLFPPAEATQVRPIQAYWLWQRLRILLSVFWHRLRRSCRAEEVVVVGTTCSCQFLERSLDAGVARGVGGREVRDQGEALDVTEWSGSLRHANRINYSREFRWSGLVVLWLKGVATWQLARAHGSSGGRGDCSFLAFWKRKATQKQSQEAVRVSLPVFVRLVCWVV